MDPGQVGAMHEGPQVMAVLNHLGSALLKSKLRAGAGRKQTQGIRLSRTRWPKSGQSFPFSLMLGPGAQGSRKHLFGGTSSHLLQVRESLMVSAG